MIEPFRLGDDYEHINLEMMNYNTATGGVGIEVAVREDYADGREVYLLTSVSEVDRLIAWLQEAKAHINDPLTKS